MCREKISQCGFITSIVSSSPYCTVIIRTYKHIQCYTYFLLAALLHIYARQRLGEFLNIVVSKESSPNFASKYKRI